MPNVKIAKFMIDNNIDWEYRAGDLWARDKAGMMIIVTSWKFNTVTNFVSCRNGK